MVAAAKYNNQENILQISRWRRRDRRRRNAENIDTNTTGAVATGGSMKLRNGIAGRWIHVGVNNDV